MDRIRSEEVLEFASTRTAYLSQSLRLPEGYSSNMYVPESRSSAAIRPERSCEQYQADYCPTSAGPVLGSVGSCNRPPVETQKLSWCCPICQRLSGPEIRYRF